MTVFIFDVDGTLTPSRRPIDERFREVFTKFVQTHTVYLATGSERHKTVEQLGEDLFAMIPKSFNCAGNQVCEYGVVVREDPVLRDSALMDDLYSWVDISEYPERYGNHVELRPGIMNFTTVGRNSDDAARLRYRAWDDIHRQRYRMREELMKKWPTYEFNIGGDISIDIYPIGKNKGQIREAIADRVVFFGDQAQYGGNDHALALALRAGDSLHHILNWEHTLDILVEQYKG